MTDAAEATERPRVIDVHSHFASVAFVESLIGRSALPRTVREGPVLIVDCAPGIRSPALPKMLDVEVKLADMAQLGIDLTVLSHNVPGPDAVGGEAADDWATRINDELARIVADRPTQIAGWASLGFGDERRTIAEVDRCLDVLDFRGFQLFSNVGGAPLDQPMVLAVLEHIARRGAAVNMHPAAPLNSIGLDRASLAVSFGFLFDTTINVARLLQAGLFDRAPDLKLIVPHVGSMLPYLAGRFANNHDRLTASEGLGSLERRMRDYLDLLYFDTVTYHPEALDMIHRSVGAERLIFGTDYPFGDYQSVVNLVAGLELSDADRARILSGNAARLLNL